MDLSLDAPKRAEGEGLLPGCTEGRPTMPIVRLFSPDEPARSGLTVRDVMDSFLAHKAKGGAQRANEDRLYCLNQFCRSFGEWSVTDLCPDDLEDWLKRRERLKSNHSKKRWCSSINAAFNWACRSKRIIPYNPVVGVVVRPGKRGRPLTNAEVKGILREATDRRMRRLVLFLRYTGCRPGEAAKALWTNLDLQRAVLILSEHKTADATGEDRVIYLSAQAVRLLALIARTDKHEHIFVNAWGLPWKQSALSQRMTGIRARAKIPADAKLYGNRHAFATEAVLRGVDIATLAQLLGHKGTRTTSTYIHLAGKDDHLHRAIEKIFGKGTATT